MLREPDGEGEERHDERPAAHPEQPRRDPDEDTEGHERDIERRAGHPRTPKRTAAPTRKAPNTTLSSRSSIRASRPAPIRAPTTDPPASPIACQYLTSPATPSVAIPATLIGMIAPSESACASRWE